MKNQKFLNRIALDDLLVDLGLENTSEAFKQKFSDDILHKYHELLVVKLKDLLPSNEFEKLLDSDQQTQDQILKDNNVDLVEVMQFTADFLRQHLEDYSKGTEEFLSKNKSS